MKKSLLMFLMSVLLGSASVTLCFAQAKDSIKESFLNYQKLSFQEKLYVHTDRDTYIAGELIWFKVYNADASLNQPVNVSKVAYIEVIDERNNPIVQVKVDLNHTGKGSLLIPSNIASGSYKFRAYTNWMKNYDPIFYFQKIISISNSLNMQQVVELEKALKPDIRFFAEGGEMIAGLNNTVAFKAVGADGMGLDIAGSVINQRDDTVIRFKSFKFGMGHFDFTPKQGDTYRAVIRYGRMQQMSAAFSACKSDGYSLKVTEPDQSHVLINVSSNRSAQQSEAFYIFVHTGKFIDLGEKLPLKEGKGYLLIEKRLFGKGISHITVFNGNHQPVCERLFFNVPEKLQINAATDSISYQQRKKVDLTISTTNENKLPVQADLSVAVYRLDSLQSGTGEDILSYLWLTSELKGYVESPGYYFSGTKDAQIAADNLMLTQGWSRYTWPDIQSAKLPSFKFLPEYEGQTIQVKVTDNDHRPVNNTLAVLGLTGKIPRLSAALSDQSGRMIFNLPPFYKNQEIVLQPLKSDTSVHLEILNSFSELYSSNYAFPSPLFVPRDFKRSMEQRSIDMQTQNIFSGKELNRYKPAKSDSSAFFGQAKVYKLDDYTRFTTIEEVLREYVSEVNVVRKKNKFHIRILNGETFLDGEPLLILDGIPVTNTDRIMAVDPLKISKLEVVPKTFYLGPLTSEGILSFTTYKGDLAGIQNDPQSIVTDYEGLQLQREFYSPVYENAAQIKSRLPDFRSLLFWNPSIRIGTDGTHKQSFFTSDEPGTYIGVAQGLGVDGKSGSTSFTFKVRK